MQTVVENNVSVTYKMYYCNTDNCNGVSSLPTKYDVVSAKVSSCYEGYWNSTLSGNFSDSVSKTQTSAPYNLNCAVIIIINLTLFFIYFNIFFNRSNIIMILKQKQPNMALF